MFGRATISLGIGPHILVIFCISNINYLRTAHQDVKEDKFKSADANIMRCLNLNRFTVSNRPTAKENACQ